MVVLVPAPPVDKSSFFNAFGCALNLIPAVSNSLGETSLTLLIFPLVIIFDVGSRSEIPSLLLSEALNLVDKPILCY